MENDDWEIWDLSKRNVKEFNNDSSLADSINVDEKFTCSYKLETPDTHDVEVYSSSHRSNNGTELKTTSELSGNRHLSKFSSYFKSPTKSNNDLTNTTKASSKFEFKNWFSPSRKSKSTSNLSEKIRERPMTSNSCSEKQSFTDTKSQSASNLFDNQREKEIYNSSFENKETKSYSLSPKLQSSILQKTLSPKNQRTRQSYSESDVYTDRNRIDSKIGKPGNNNQSNVKVERPDSGYYSPGERKEQSYTITFTPEKESIPTKNGGRQKNTSPLKEGLLSLVTGVGLVEESNTNSVISSVQEPHSTKESGVFTLTASKNFTNNSITPENNSNSLLNHNSFESQNKANIDNTQEIDIENGDFLENNKDLLEYKQNIEKPKVNVKQENNEFFMVLDSDYSYPKFSTPIIKNEVLEKSNECDINNRKINSAVRCLKFHDESETDFSADCDSNFSNSMKIGRSDGRLMLESDEEGAEDNSISKNGNSDESEAYNCVYEESFPASGINFKVHHVDGFNASHSDITEATQSFTDSDSIDETDEELNKKSFLEDAYDFTKELPRDSRLDSFEFHEIECRSPTVNSGPSSPSKSFVEYVNVKKEDEYMIYNQQNGFEERKMTMELLGYMPSILERSTESDEAKSGMNDEPSQLSFKDLSQGAENKESALNEVESFLEGCLEIIIEGEEEEEIEHKNIENMENIMNGDNNEISTNKGVSTPSFEFNLPTESCEDKIPTLFEQGELNHVLEPKTSGDSNMEKRECDLISSGKVSYSNKLPVYILDSENRNNIIEKNLSDSNLEKVELSAVNTKNLDNVQTDSITDSLKNNKNQYFVDVNNIDANEVQNQAPEINSYKRAQHASNPDAKVFLKKCLWYDYSKDELEEANIETDRTDDITKNQTLDYKTNSSDNTEDLQRNMINQSKESINAVGIMKNFYNDSSKIKHNDFVGSTVDFDEKGTEKAKSVYESEVAVPIYNESHIGEVKLVNTLFEQLEENTDNESITSDPVSLEVSPATPRRFLHRNKNKASKNVKQRSSLAWDGLMVQYRDEDEYFLTDNEEYSDNDEQNPSISSVVITNEVDYACYLETCRNNKLQGKNIYINQSIHIDEDKNKEGNLDYNGHKLIHSDAFDDADDYANKNDNLDDTIVNENKHDDLTNSFQVFLQDISQSKKEFSNIPHPSNEIALQTSPITKTKQNYQSETIVTEIIKPKQVSFHDAVISDNTDGGWSRVRRMIKELPLVEHEIPKQSFDLMNKMKSLDLSQFDIIESLSDPEQKSDFNNTLSQNEAHTRLQLKGSDNSEINLVTYCNKAGDIRPQMTEDYTVISFDHDVGDDLMKTENEVVFDKKSHNSPQKIQRQNDLTEEEEEQHDSGMELSDDQLHSSAEPVDQPDTIESWSRNIKPLLCDAEVVAKLYTDLANNYISEDMCHEQVEMGSTVYKVIRENRLCRFDDVIIYLFDFNKVVCSDLSSKITIINNIIIFLEGVIIDGSFDILHVEKIAQLLSKPNKYLYSLHNSRVSILKTCFTIEMKILKGNLSTMEYLVACFTKICQYFVQFDKATTRLMVFENLMPNLHTNNIEDFISSIVEHTDLQETFNQEPFVRDAVKTLLLLQDIFSENTWTIESRQILRNVLQVKSRKFEFCNRERLKLVKTLS